MGKVRNSRVLQALKKKINIHKKNCPGLGYKCTKEHTSKSLCSSGMSAWLARLVPFFFFC